MLNTCIFLIDDLKPLHHSDESTLKGCVFACVIKGGSSFEKYKIDALYDLELLENAGLFTFYIDITTNEDCKTFFEWVTKNEKVLFRYFFHPNYKIKQNEPLLFVNAAIKENKTLINTVSYLNEKIIDQGYDGIRCLWLSEDTGDNEQDVNLVLNADKSGKTLSTLYVKILSEDIYVSKYIGLRSADFKNDLKDLKTAEDTFLKQHPQTYHLLRRNCDLEKDSLDLKEEIKNIKLQLQNQKTYLQLIRQQDEANKINNFYHNEYEILPFWYKKIGHIIKVLTGKRTFRSLFDNNVKKYKE